jgi:hypothetical protein
MKLKELITSAPVLILPNDDLPFRLEADGVVFIDLLGSAR